MKIIVLTFILGFSSCWIFLPIPPNPAFALNLTSSRRRTEEIPYFELGKIVVTASRKKEQIKDIPRNVTVITSDDIENGPAYNVLDLLARESGISLVSYYGLPVKAGVDIRGMGDTRGSNIIVMIDGMRVNPPDMAGPDFSSVSLNQIERIEIIRGQESVIYGDGAVSGVINIITKRGSTKPQADVFSSFGSYETKDFRSSFSAGLKDSLLSVNASYYDSKGYRDNNKLIKRDAALYYSLSFTDYLNLDFKASFNKNSYGLPGPIYKKDRFSRDARRATNRPRDSGEVNQRHFILAMEIDLDTKGLITLQRGYRFRKDLYFMGLNTDTSGKEGEKNLIDEEAQELNMNYINSYELGGIENRLQFGIDYHETEYVTERYSSKMRKNVRIRDWGIFATNDCTLMEKLVLRLGYRWNRCRVLYRSDDYKFLDQWRWVNNMPRIKKWINYAYDLGLVFPLTHDIILFASAAASFRTPNVDELAKTRGDILSQNRDSPDLRPQKGDHLELGMRHSVNDLMELAVTVFQISIKDEIYYKEVNRNNEDKSLRRGFEADIRFYPADSLYLWGNYSFIEAKFNKHSFIPLVSKHKASIGAQYSIFDKVILNISGLFVSPSFNGNYSEGNNMEKLGGYEVMDIKVSYIYKNLRFFMGVNNFLNEYYSTFEYDQDYYPMPERNLYTGLKWEF